MTDTVVAEGQVKFRDGKKWKTRWVVLQKPSPVADCLTLLVWKEKKKGKSGRHKDRLNVTLEGICGVEPGPGYDGVSYTLSILCLAHSLVLGFSSRDTLLAWDTRLRYSLGEVHRFSISVEPGTKLESGPASLHLCNNLLVLTRGVPPVVVGSWKLSALRRYGAVPNGFVFEGGTRCGLWAGVYFLSCSEGEQISFLFDCIVRGIAPSRALRPTPPGLNADPALAEERISQETSELEKRLSLLSHCSLASSSASSSSYSPSAAGDDRSISSSSSSQSETSCGGRPPFWMEPSLRSLLSNETASSTSTLKALTRSEDRLGGPGMGGPGSRPSSAQLCPRGLHDSGRQSSLDSGIGIATGSQSSYSGSYSSCAGSLDMASQGGGEEYGSVVSLPPQPPPAPPPSPPPSPVHGRSASSQACTSKNRASNRHSEEYQPPSLLRWWYDTPRSLLQALSLRGPPARGATPDPSEGDGQGQVLNTDERTNSVDPERTNSVDPERTNSVDSERTNSVDSERTNSVDSERTNSVDSERTNSESNDGRSTPRPQLVPVSPAHRETQAESSSFSDFSATFTPATQKLCVREKLCEGEDAGKLGSLSRTLLSSPPSAPPPPPVVFRLPSAATFLSAFEARRLTSTQNEPRGGRNVNYVNIPLGLQKALTAGLLYTELDLQRHASAPVSSSYSVVGGDSLQLYKPAEADSIRYAHLDMAAMETAQRVRAEPVQGRKDRLTQLESRWRGPPN
ncbi:protein Dok-7 isoform X2 [Austrofundulus limnaeus]|uniref:Protein Dok-7 isoform X2 n=1 Tax=Austrofundulus limnaeus TaxID=52670 RepID=A0A2I4C0N8_AUSLI|nr:PREDICTED: protein Dok-7-like isoform X2 [Austrofundulus limnaeus]